MSGERQPVWFERTILPDLAAEVGPQVLMLGPGTDDDPYAGLAGAAGAVAGILTYDGAVMDRAPGLRVIARTGIGVDTVDIPAATRRGIAVCNAPDGPTVSTAEHAVMLMLAVAKNLKHSEAHLRSGTGNYYAAHRAVELDSRTIGLAGFGRIARRVAAAVSGLGMRVVVYDPYIDPDGLPSSVTSTDTLHELLAISDVISVHIPLTDETSHLFNAAAFAAMPQGAVFINTARGGLVDHDALLDALESGHLLGAALDVTDPEPLPPDHPLLHRNDVIVTPHVASGTHAGKRRIFRIALDQVVHVLRGDRPPHLVNPEVWERLVATPPKE
jgi:phosphoglycerate dehydrogenase-like enzyme